MENQTKAPPFGTQRGEPVGTYCSQSVLTSVTPWCLRSEQLNRRDLLTWEASSWSRCRDSTQNRSQGPDRLGRNSKTRGATPEAEKSQGTRGHGAPGQRAPQVSGTWRAFCRPTLRGLTLSCQEEAKVHAVTSGGECREVHPSLGKDLPTLFGTESGRLPFLRETCSPWDVRVGRPGPRVFCSPQDPPCFEWSLAWSKHSEDICQMPGIMEAQGNNVSQLSSTVANGQLLCALY